MSVEATADELQTGPRIKVKPRGNAMVALWAGYDIFTAYLAILIASDALNRFGVASYVWLLVYALVLARIALVWRAAFDVALRNLPYFVYPAVCGVSVLWSFNDAVTLKAAAQLTVTVIIALFIGWRFSLGFICLLQFAACFTGVFLSLVNWATGIFGNAYGDAGNLLGVYTQKNMLGQRALFACLSALAIIMLPVRTAFFALIKLGVLVALGITFILLALSMSVTPLLLVPCFMGLLIALNAHSLPRGLVATGLFLGVVLVALAPLGFALANVNPVVAIFEAFGKSTTLTGRTNLWDLAVTVISERPFLGVGYSAFWSSGPFYNFVLAAQDIGGDAVTSFHNFVLEIWVATGLPGLVAMLILIATTLRRTLTLYLRTRSVMAAFALSATLAAIALSLVGTSLFRQHEHMIMFVVMIGVAAQRELAASYASASWRQR